MLIVSSWSEQFRADIGLKGVSQVWGGPPAWYIWLADAPGVYHLALLATEEKKQRGKALYKAEFAVKCYPYPDDACFQGFSFLEQTLINSDFFDKTHTPVFECRGKIPPDLFTIGMVEVAMDHEAHMASFCIETQDILRSRYAAETDQFFPILDLDRKFVEGEIDRDIPGLKMAYPLFDCLMCLYANAGKQAPLQIRCSKAPGFEIVIERGNVNATPNKAINGYRLDVRYAATVRNEHNNNVLMQTDSKECREAFFYERMFPCGHFHEDQEDERLPISVNRNWWSLAHKHYVSELASSCGCH
ncbi:hypothetical protein DSCA_17280 [Desulfosarcina alkanivorans]|uniref:Uncharacterized protein n=2 Tax=Desulfosarcina alkanivorans TaxID=571177 RepID=A0A5K7YFG9_9BACT|nr:hypothetical protein DSCA_17280 [Desulfosarcina alkanivorans]